MTEAIDAGAGIEQVRHHATHSNVSMTGRYDRATLTKTRTVAAIRAAGRAQSEPRERARERLIIGNAP